MTDESLITLPPRVLVVMPAQWPRALLRAALRDVGYDAVGAQSLASALRIRPDEPQRGPVRLVIVDHDAFDGPRRPAQFLALRNRHHTPLTMLIVRSTVQMPPVESDRVLKRPVSVGDIVAAAESLLPLPRGKRHAIE
jgi:DNA-binding response OmpR family regulator